MKKKRALFIYDQHGWAWDFMTRGIIKNLPEDWHGIPMKLDEVMYRGWWAYDGVWFWNPNLLFLTIKRDTPIGMSDIPPYPDKLDRKKLIAIRKSNAILGYYGSTRTEQRIKWGIELGIDLALICKKYYDIATRLSSSHDKFHVVHPAVDHEIFYPNPIEHNGFVVAWAGHAGWEFKRTYLLDHLHYEIKMASNWGIKFFVKDRPWGEDMARFYNNCDAYVCVSKQEGIPQPILEAAACGLPILSTDVGGISDFLDGEFLCPPFPEKDVVKFMNENLERWEANPKLAREVGQRNLQKILDDWTWKQRAKEIVGIWERK